MRSDSDTHRPKRDTTPWARFSIRTLGIAAAVLSASCGGAVDEARLYPDGGAGDGAAAGRDGGRDGGTIDPGPAACTGTQIRCGDVCAEPATDPDHCGSCDRRCPAASACISGICTCPTGGGLAMCGGACVDTTSDAAHCGGCEQRCRAGETCTSGTCTCAAPAVPVDGRCVDVTSDPRHCGAPGHECRPTERCSGSACVCLPGLTSIPAAGGSRCVDLQSDPDNCGLPGQSCAGDVCSMGACMDECRADGLRECDGACVDTGSSVLHCGDCGRSCDPGELCVDGECRGYRPATRCVACPCDTCDGSRCCEISGALLVCLQAERCP